MNAMLAGVLRGVLRPAQHADKRPPRKKPSGLVYAVDDVPPPLITSLNAVQHVGVIAINLVYPVLIFRAVDTPVEVVSSLLAMVIWSLAIGTFLQVYRFGPVGTGFMCPATPTATYFAPSLLAVRLGGLPMLFGMTIFAGLLEAAIAPLLNRLRAIFPPEISGLVILMIGMSAGVAGLRSMLGADIAAVATSEWCVAGVTLATMVLLNVWGRGILRMVCALTGLAVGYVAAGFAGLLGQFAAVGEAPWIGLPSLGHLSWSFDATLIAPFAIASVAAAMKAAGTIAVCQKTNDADWTRPDMQSVTSGVLADGLGTAAAGLVGGVGINTSTPVVGLAQATGVASRQVAIAVGGMFLLLGFFPKLTALLAVMPRSVIVPALLFAVTFIIINGLQVISSRLLDARRTLVLGLSLIAGLAVEVFPSIAAMAPKPLAPLVGSSLVLSTLLALALNLLFRIGVKKTVRLTIEFRAGRLAKDRGFSPIECRQMGRPAGCGQARDLRGAAIARSRGRKLLARRPDHGRGELRRVQPRYSRLVSRRGAGVSGSPAVDRTDPRQRRRRPIARGLHAAPQRRPRALGRQGRTGAGAFSFRSLTGSSAPPTSAWRCSRRASRRS